MGRKTFLKINYLQVAFVFTAFAVMVVIGSMSVIRVIDEEKRTTVTVALSETEKNIRSYLREPKIAFDNIYAAVQNMLDEGESQDRIRQYLGQTTKLLCAQEDGVRGFVSVFGYIRDEYISGSGLEGKIIPQQRPWYQLAIRSEGAEYTAPYVDFATERPVISLTRRVYGKNGGYYGVLALDIDLSWLREYAQSLQLSKGGYGMVINQYLYTIAHPDKQLLDTRLQDLGAGYAGIADMLNTGRDVTAAHIRDFDGTRILIFFKRLYNGWHVGVVMPASSYYADLYLTIFVLAVMGAVLALVLSWLLIRLSAERDHSEQESRSKSSFLARMSHEIRTPVNAIMGMTELALREELPPAAYGHMRTVKQASANLLAIINDILDFSKIESGKLEIVPREYLLSSLLHDVVSIIRMRARDSHNRFVVNVDGNIPGTLFGDDSKLRQALINILNNAVKFTEKGHISFTVTGKVDEETDILALTVEVADSGRGIKPEDMDKLFGDFVQIDVANNKGVEGTGLGLAITRSIVEAMGGSISVQSEYGRGSTFTIALPQKICGREPIAAVEAPEQKGVLVYERRELAARSILCAIENVGVNCALVQSDKAFHEKLSTRSWPFVFVASALYENVRDACEKAGVKPMLIANFGETVADSSLHILTLPIYSVYVAQILNGLTDDFYANGDRGLAVSFVAPDARVLIVDDIDTNLKVAVGLLAPYQMHVRLCRSGAEAIETIQSAAYDLVLMDHMMPEMDGIEATRRIRSLIGARYQNLCVIALTANAVSGVKELFLQNGFNDFLSKPIDTFKLDSLLSKWLPQEKQKKSVRWTGGNLEEEYATDIVLEGADVAKGIAMTGGTLKGYLRILEVFHKDGHEKMNHLRHCVATDNFALYTTHVHALKSATSVIGAQALSEAARALEEAGCRGDVAYIQTHNDSFLAALETFLDRMERMVPSGGQTEGRTDMDTLKTELSRLKEALGAVDPDMIDEASEGLQAFAQKAETGAFVREILQNTLLGKYGDALSLIDAFMNERQ